MFLSFRALPPWGESCLHLEKGQVLVEALRMSNKLDDAELLSKDIVSKITSILGETHPDTLGAMDSLAEIVAGRKDFERALEGI